MRCRVAQHYTEIFIGELISAIDLLCSIEWIGGFSTVSAYADKTFVQLDTIPKAFSCKSLDLYRSYHKKILALSNKQKYNIPRPIFYF